MRISVFIAAAVLACSTVCPCHAQEQDHAQRETLQTPQTIPPSIKGHSLGESWQSFKANVMPNLDAHCSDVEAQARAQATNDIKHNKYLSYDTSYSNALSMTSFTCWNYIKDGFLFKGERQVSCDKGTQQLNRDGVSLCQGFEGTVFFDESDKLVRIDVAYYGDSWDDVLNAAVKKLGMSPTTSSIRTSQNGYGAQWDTHHAIWVADTYVFTLDETLSNNWHSIGVVMMSPSEYQRLHPKHTTSLD